MTERGRALEDPCVYAVMALQIGLPWAKPDTDTFKVGRFSAHNEDYLQKKSFCGSLCDVTSTSMLGTAFCKRQHFRNLMLIAQSGEGS